MCRVSRPRADAPPRLAYTVPEVAKALGMSRSTAYELVAKGEIPSLRIGTRLVVPVKALDELLSAAS